MIFHSYVKLPEGNCDLGNLLIWLPSCFVKKDLRELHLAWSQPTTTKAFSHPCRSLLCHIRGGSRSCDGCHHWRSGLCAIVDPSFGSSGSRKSGKMQSTSNNHKTVWLFLLVCWIWCVSCFAGLVICLQSAWNHWHKWHNFTQCGQRTIPNRSPSTQFKGHCKSYPNNQK